jgi:hypothetical protein
MSSISRLVLLGSLVVSLLFFVLTYLLLSGFGDRMLKQSTTQNLQSLSSITFSAMYQNMSQGWKREQAQDFANTIAQSVGGAPMKIAIVRTEVVSDKFGKIDGQVIDDEMAKAIANGMNRVIDTEGGQRFIYPTHARAECLGCHTNAKSGDVLGVIDIQAGYKELVGNERQLLGIVLLILSPFPLIAGFVITFVLDSRTSAFQQELDAAIEKAEPGQMPDFNPVRAHFSEYRELLGHFKRLVKA